jgi:uncharacterized membrane protein YkoI
MWISEDFEKTSKRRLMKTYQATLLAAVLSISALGLAEEKTISRSDLPPAVEKSLQQQLSGAAVKGFSAEKENGRVMYEAQLIVDGHTKDILFDASGAIQEVEEEVAFDSLPVEVKASLRARAKNGKITKVESLVKQDKLVAYEAQVEKNGKHSEIQVGPKGERLMREV